MKKIFSGVLSILLWTIATLLNQNAFAHFGSKGPFGGTVTCLIEHDSVVYIGTSGAGVYESTNKSLVAWRARPVGLKQGTISALAHSGKFLYAATPDSGIFRFSGYSGNDRYWEHKSSGLEGLKITCMIALDSNSILIGTKNDGLFKSTDNGETWSNVNNAILHHYEITGIVKVGNRIIHTSMDGGAWASDDLGLSWYDYNDDQTLHVDYTKFIALNKSSNEIIVSNIDGLYKTSAISKTDPVYDFVNENLPEGITIKSIYSAKETWYLVTNQGVFSSPTGEISWTKISMDLPNEVFTSIVLSGETLIAGTSNTGVFKSNETTIKWTLFNSNFNAVKTYSFASQDNLIFVANQFGLYISKDLATSYSTVNTGISDSLNVNDVCIGDFCLLVATKNAGVFFSPDTGKTWNAINKGLENLNIAKLFCDSKNYLKYCIDSNGKLYKSQLHSDTWSLISTGLPSELMPKSLTYYNSNLLICGPNGKVFLKQNDGIWQEQSSGLPLIDITSIQYFKGHIYAGTKGKGVYICDTTSFEWNSVNASPINAHTGFVNNYYHSDYIEAIGANTDYLFVSYRGGVFASSDMGETWVPGGNQFNLPTYSSIKKINMATGRVFVSTEFNSVYSNSLSELPVISGLFNSNNLTESIEFYPNPTKGVLNFDTDIIEIEIYNNNGVFIKKYSAQDGKIDLSELSKGSYLLKAFSPSTTNFTQIIVN